MERRSELIRELASDLRPAPRLRAPWKLALLWWLGAWLFVVAATLAMEPMRPGFVDQLLGSPRFAGETLFGFVLGALAIGAAFALSIPGLGRPRRWIAGTVALLAIWTSVYLYALVHPALEPSTLGARHMCFVEVWLYGVPVLLAALLLMRRLAPLDRVGAGFVAGAAAGALPAALMQLACMYVPSHILMYHLAPGFALALVGAVFGRFLLRRI